MKINFISLLVFILFLSGCDQASVSSSSSIKPDKECVFPQNPYNDGGGHNAGFNWAAENGGNCNGNSDSFNDGCNEYYIQLNRYNDCIKSSSN